MRNTIYRHVAFGALAALLLAPITVLAATPAYDSDGSTQLQHRLQDAGVLAYEGRVSDAIATTTAVIAQSENFGYAYYDRSFHLIRAGRFEEASHDLDRVFAMHPDAAELEAERAYIDLLRGDPKAALDDVRIAAKMPKFSFWHSPFLAAAGEFANGTRHGLDDYTIGWLLAITSVAELELKQDDLALADLDRMLKVEELNDKDLLAEYCDLASVRQQWDMAELTCQESIERDKHDIGQYETLGYVHLNQKAWAKAVADFTTSLDGHPKRSFSLYGRGLARQAMGDQAGGQADISTAVALEPDIANMVDRRHWH